MKKIRDVQPNAFTVEFDFAFEIRCGRVVA
jgi:hypothetical protein